MSKYDDLLHKIIEDVSKASTQNRPFHCIFDLDSTLFNVTPRTNKILDELLLDETFKSKFPNELTKLEKLHVKHDDWGIKEALIRFGIECPDFFKASHEFWAKKFFSNFYLQFDTPYEGAVDFVNDLYKSGAHISYLTARDQVRMLEGTIKSLNQWKFPYEQDNVDLVLKEKPKGNDVEYKCKYLVGLTPGFEKLYFFENEPVIIHKVEEQLPEVEIIFMDSVHSGKAEPMAHWPNLNMTYLK